MQDLPVQSLVKQVFGGGELGNFKRSFIGEAGMLKDTGGESEVASVKHELGVSGGGGLDAQVSEHGVGFPVAKQHDGFCANIGTEQGSGAAQPQ